MWWVEHAVIAMVKLTGSGAKFFIFILRFEFFNFQQEGAEWGRTGRVVVK